MAQVRTDTEQAVMTNMLLESLRALGVTPLDVALHLQHFKVKGIPLSLSNNPVAVYVRNVMQSNCALVSSVNAVAYWENSDPVFFDFRYAFPQITEFIREFDNGRYRELAGK